LQATYESDRLAVLEVRSSSCENEREEIRNQRSCLSGLREKSRLTLIYRSSEYEGGEESYIESGESMGEREHGGGG